MLNRRQFVWGAAALVGGTLPVWSALAQTSSNRKFVFVFAPGGWDVTRVFAPAFDNPNVDMEQGEDVGVRSLGDLEWVSHSDRPSVDAFFERHAMKSAVVNGLLTRSINHDVARMLALTGSTSGQEPDWPAIIGFGDQVGFPLPHWVISGPSWRFIFSQI